MKRLMNCAVAALLLTAILLSACVICAAKEDKADPFPDVSKASAICFYHVESQRRMGAKNEATVLPAGTSVRLLSGLLFCERLAHRLGETVLIREEMIADAKSYYGYGLQEGDFYTVEQLLYLSLCGGCNDAFYVLAHLLGEGNVQSFVAQMNQRAAELGAVDTTATDPSGIADTSYTTALDLLEISKTVMENELYMQISGSVFYDFYDRIENRNALVSSAQEKGRYENPKCAGMTVGVTDRGDWSVVTLAQKGQDRYLCVVLGAEGGLPGDSSEKYGYVIANRLIQWGYDNYAYLEVLNPETVICTLPVEVSDLVDEVSVKAMESLSFYLPADVTVGEELQFSVRLMYESLEAPVDVGTHVGYVAVIYQGEVLGTVAIYTADAAPRGGFAGGLMQIRKWTEKRAVRAGLVFFAVSLLGLCLTEFLIRRAKRRRWDRYFSEKIDTSETFLKRNSKNSRGL